MLRGKKEVQKHVDSVNPFTICIYGLPIVSGCLEKEVQKSRDVIQGRTKVKEEVSMTECFDYVTKNRQRLNMIATIKQNHLPKIQSQ